MIPRIRTVSTTVLILLFLSGLLGCRPVEPMLTDSGDHRLPLCKAVR